MMEPTTPRDGQGGHRPGDAPGSARPAGARWDAESGYQTLFRQREELDRTLDSLRRKVTVMFSDIVAYTRYVSAHGDVEGRLLQMRHERLLREHIEPRGGIVVKTIGDAVMVRFDDACAAVDSACRVVRTLARESLPEDSPEAFQVRIGVATGKALVEAGDLNGDVVNTASRLCKRADINNILAAESTFEDLDGYLQGFCVPQDPLALRGAESSDLRAYRIVWDYRGGVRGRSTDTDRLVLDVVLEGDRLRQSLYRIGSGQETVHQYAHLDWDEAAIRMACVRVTQALKRATQAAGHTHLRELRDAGASLYDRLLAGGVKQLLKSTTLEYLTLNVQDQLVFVPWELLFDGDEFLCRRFAIGRRVSSRAPARAASREWTLRPLVSVVSDPRGNLKAAQTEGEQLTSLLSASDRFSLAMKSGAGVNYVSDALRRSHVVHFCGHAEYDDDSPARSGWLLADGTLTASDIRQMAENDKPFPSLIFSNACHSGRTDQWARHGEERLYDLASAFLLAGVRHYVGTLWDVADDPSRELALHFYRGLVKGRSMGAALRDARRAVAGRAGDENLIWASYVLYGDPAQSLFGEPDALSGDGRRTQSAESEDSAPESMAAAPLATEAFAADAFAADALAVDAIAASPVEAAEAPMMAVRSGGGRDTHAAGLWKTLAAAAGILIVGWLAWLTVQERQPAPLPAPPPSAFNQYLLALDERFSDPEYAAYLEQQDLWTSRPLTVGVLVFAQSGVDPALTMTAEWVRDTLTNALMGWDRTTVLERDRFTEILHELESGASDLASPDLRARLGQMRFCRVFVTGHVIADGPRQYIRYVAFDNETTVQIASGFLAVSDDPSWAAISLWEDLQRALQAEYPLQARVVETIADKGVYLNAGKDMGLAKGHVLHAIDEERGMLRGVARFRVEEVGSRSAYAVPDGAIDWPVIRNNMRLTEMAP